MFNLGSWQGESVCVYTLGASFGEERRTYISNMFGEHSHTSESQHLTADSWMSQKKPRKGSREGLVQHHKNIPLDFWTTVNILIKWLSSPLIVTNYQRTGVHFLFINGCCFKTPLTSLVIAANYTFLYGVKRINNYTYSLSIQIFMGAYSHTHIHTEI